MILLDFFLFRRMITDEVMILLHPLGSLLIFVLSVLAVVQGFRLGGPGQGVVSAVVLLVFGNLLWRVFCEGLVALVAIHERLREVRDALREVRAPTDREAIAR